MAFFGFLSNLLEYGCSVLLPDMNRRRQTSLCVTSVAGNVCIYYYIPLLGPSWLADQFRFGKQRRLMQKLTEIWELRKQSLLKLDYMTVINPKKKWYVWTNFFILWGLVRCCQDDDVYTFSMACVFWSLKTNTSHWKFDINLVPHITARSVKTI